MSATHTLTAPVQSQSAAFYPTSAEQVTLLMSMSSSLITWSRSSSCTWLLLQLKRMAESTTDHYRQDDISTHVEEMHSCGRSTARNRARSLTFTRFTFFPTSNFLKYLSILRPIFS